MRQSDSIENLAAALAKAQGEIDDASKTGLNPAFKSRYADLAAVRAVIREPLAVNDLAIIQLPRTLDGAVEVETMILHKSGEFIAETLRMPVNKWDSHGIGSGITYARRYGCMALLGIAADDDDGNAAVERTPAPAPVKKAVEKDMSYIRKAANEAAKGGGISLQNWWKTLKLDEREAFDADERKSLKEIAAEVDGKTA